MSTVRERLLGAFEPGVRAHIVEYAKQVSGIETDLIVLMARKAACFVDALQDAGLLSIDRPVTSERALDMDLSWVAGKSVTIVDDVLVSGSSLYRTRERLLAAGAARVELIVLSVDRDNDAGLVTIDPGHLSLSEQDSVRMCTQVVQGIALVPRPYNVDWPLLDGVTLPITQMPYATNLPGWNVTDLSSNAQAAAGVLALTYEATSSTVNGLDESIGWPLSRVAPLIKVRLYAYQGEDSRNLGPGRAAPGKGRMRLRGLPIVSMGALRVTDIDQLFSMFRDHNPGLSPDAWDAFHTPEAKLRLLQFACSARLGDLWRSHLAACADVDGWASLAPLQVGYAFAPHLVDHVQAVCRNPAPFLLNAPAVELAPIESPAEPMPSAHVGFGCDAVQARLAEPFLRLYEHVELRARAALKARGAAALADPNLQALTNRLRTGLRLEELENVAATSVGTDDRCERHPDAEQVRSFVSLFLDLAVDHGVIVPIMEQRDGCVLRTFRHGEDVNFAESEIRLAGLLLAELASAMRVTVLPKILVEKALVLMVRHGIAESWLTQFYGRLGKQGTVGIRPDLHGAVVHSRSPDFFGHKEDSSLAHMLAACGVLETRRDGYIVTGTLPPAPTQTPHESKAKALGASIGELLAGDARGKALLSERELMLLATIPTARDVPLALGAEVEIFHRRWEFQRGSGFPVARAQAPAWRQYDAALGEDITAVALASGVMKYRAYLDEDVPAIIERVAQESSAASSRFEWQARWDALRTDESGSSTGDLRQITDRLGRWLIRAQALFLLLRATKAGADGGPDAARLVRVRYREASELINLLAGSAKAKAIAAYREADLALKSGSTEEVSAPIIAALDELHEEALPLIDAARATAGHFGRPLSITTYSAACVVTLRHGDTDEASRRLASLLERRKRAATPRHVLVDALPDDPNQPGRLVVLLRGEGAGRHLASLVGRAFDLSDAFNVDVIAVPDLQLVLPAYKGNGGEIHAAGLLRLIERLPAPTRDRRAGLRVLAPSGSGQTEVLLRDANGQSDYAIPSSGVRTTPRGFPDTWEETLVTVGGPRRLRVDVGILSILPEEHRAVLNAIGGPAGLEDRIDGTGRRITLGVLRPPSDVGSPLSSEDAAPLAVACTQAADQGPSSIQAAYEALQQEARPTFTVLVGIAGGVHDDVELGDVVIATDMLCYDRRAETAEGTAHRPTNFRMHIKVQHELNNFFVVNGASVPGGAGAFTMHKGPIGTGQAVIKSSLSETRLWLKSVNDKILAVEMEAEGIATAARETGRDDAYLIVRGISDHADEDKRNSDNNGARDLACENALSVVCLIAPPMVEAIRRGKTDRDELAEEHTPSA